ncbi:MAG: ammonia-forming cytochrome c nitrite reductase subunit c552, partial [Desulfofustis sp.]|nr:ammonia-forming cytochrome c nitrite reductase subunit c552 [Desulfofustis sp.]
MKKCLMLSVLLLLGWGVSNAAAEEATCESCHEENNPGLYLQWKNSAHGENDVGCLDCHEADAGDVDAYEHNGAIIATLVTPYDCSNCHEQQAQETMDSYHAHAGEILESSDAYLAHAAGGHPIVIVGCESC